MGRADQLAAPHLVRIPNYQLADEKIMFLFIPAGTLCFVRIPKYQLADKKITFLLSQAGTLSSPLLPHYYHHLTRLVESFFVVDSGSKNTVLQIRENIQ